LPGMRAFSYARERLGSRVDAVVGDFMTTDVDPCDVVLFLGVLYHVENPLLTLRRLRALTRELAVIETAATHVAGHDRPLFGLFPSNGLDGEVSKWGSPNEPGLHGLCHAAGFSNVETVARPPLDQLELVDGVARYRLVVHAS